MHRIVKTKKASFLNWIMIVKARQRGSVFRRHVHNMTKSKWQPEHCSEVLTKSSSWCIDNILKYAVAFVEKHSQRTFSGWDGLLKFATMDFFFSFPFLISSSILCHRRLNKSSLIAHSTSTSDNMVRVLILISSVFQTISAFHTFSLLQKFEKTFATDASPVFNGRHRRNLVKHFLCYISYPSIVMYNNSVTMLSKIRGPK